MDKTCDKPLCRDHAVKVGKHLDYCHDHGKDRDITQPQGDLF